jgi:hypothetical protein
MFLWTVLAPAPTITRKESGQTTARDTRPAGVAPAAGSGAARA